MLNQRLQEELCSWRIVTNCISKCRLVLLVQAGHRDRSERRWKIYCSDWSRWCISEVWVVRVARVVPIVFPEAANTFSRRDFENWTNTHKVGHQCCETMEPMLETMEQTQNSDPKWLQSPFCCLAHTAHITDIEQYSIDVWSLTRQPPAPALAE